MYYYEGHPDQGKNYLLKQYIMKAIRSFINSFVLTVLSMMNFLWNNYFLVMKQTEMRTIEFQTRKVYLKRQIKELFFYMKVVFFLYRCKISLYILIVEKNLYVLGEVSLFVLIV